METKMKYQCEVYGPFGPDQRAEELTLTFYTAEQRQLYVDGPRQLSAVLRTWEEDE